jgi:hypothetical protein
MIASIGLEMRRAGRRGGGSASPSKDDELLLSFIWSAITMTTPAGAAEPDQPLGLALRRLMIPSATPPSASSAKTINIGSSAAPAGQPPLCHVRAARLGSALPACPVAPAAALSLFSQNSGTCRPFIACCGTPASSWGDLEPVCLSPFCKRVGPARQTVSRCPHLHGAALLIRRRRCRVASCVPVSSGVADSITLGTAGTGSTVKRGFQIRFQCVGRFKFRTSLGQSVCASL